MPMEKSQAVRYVADLADAGALSCACCGMGTCREPCEIIRLHCNLHG